MAILAYNISSQLKDYLQKIDLLRQKILLTPLSPKSECRFRWEATLERTYWSLVLAQSPISKNEVLTLLSKTKKGRLSNIQKDVISYKKALDYIKQNWLASNRKITPTTIKKLYDISSKPTLGSAERSFKAGKKELSYFLDYLQEGAEHPVVQAGIGYIQTYNIAPFRKAAGRIARLTTYLFLYRYGYDFRGTLVFDEFMRRDLTALRQARQTVTRHNNNLTLWLEYFAYTVGVQADKAMHNLVSGQFKTTLPSPFWELNERQKEILNLLDVPGFTITNKKVQKEFKVSQITASRDLAKLTHLGLLFSHGKGRSRYYSKV